MKKNFLRLALAVLTVGLLGSCSKINERLDNLEKKVSGIESEQIASINSQIDGIKTSIADLGTIRSDISSLKQSASDHSVDIFNLEEADRALKDRILNLEDYVDAVLPNYAEKEWVEATFSTLEQYEATCDTIAKIDARIGALDAKLSNDIKATADSLTKWVNKQFEGYYTAAQMDAKLAQMKSAIDSSKASGKITDAKADSIATELTNAKAAVDTAKANIRKEYRAAIDTAIKASEGKLTKELTDAIKTVNGKIESLVTRVDNLAAAVADLTVRVKALEEMIQSVVIVPAYSDGSVKIANDSLYIDCIVSPSKAVANLVAGNVAVLVNKVKTKANTGVDTIKIIEGNVFEKDADKGVISVRVFIKNKIPAAGSTLTVAVNVKKDKSDFTTEFVPVYVAGPVLPAGALSGVFTVDDDGQGNVKKVHFSQGNLTYDINASTNKWKFYEHQYDCAANGDASSTLISLFTWGYSASTSLNPKGETYVEDHTTDGDKLVYDKASSEGGDDWGVAYCESNEIAVGTWRTLSTNEWQYLFNTREVNGGIGEGYSYSLNITYGGKKGLVLYPDDYSGSTLTSGTDYTDANFPADCVFLPAAGYRNGSDVLNVGDYGLYWSSTALVESRAYGVDFLSYGVSPDSSGARCGGFSVRLITKSN